MDSWFLLWNKLRNPTSIPQKPPINTDPIIPSASWYDNLGPTYQKSQSHSHKEGLINNMSAFRAHLEPSSLVLDCGCGTGNPVASMLIEYGHRVHGIDWSQTMVEISRQQVPEGTFEQVNMLDFDPPERTFDGIVAMFSLFELSRKEIEGMAEKWAKWIKSGGYILLGVFGAENC